MRVGEKILNLRELCLECRISKFAYTKEEAGKLHKKYFFFLVNTGSNKIVHFSVEAKIIVARSRNKYLVSNRCLKPGFMRLGIIITVSCTSLDWEIDEEKM